MINLKTLLLASLVVVGAATVTAPLVSAAGCANPKDCVTTGFKSASSSSSQKSVGALITAIVTALMFILGAVAVVMIVIGGIKYAVSQGDSSAVSSAKNTILYAVIGLVVAILGYAIVKFVVDRLAA